MAQSISANKARVNLPFLHMRTSSHYGLHSQKPPINFSDATHLVLNAYGPRTFGPPQWGPKLLVPLDKQSPTNSVPMDRWSQKIWSPWTNPNQFGPLEYFICPGRQAVGIQNYGDWIGWGPFLQADKIFGTFCPWGLNLLGSFVQGDRFYGDGLSRGTGSEGLKVHGSNGFETKCVAANLSTEVLLLDHPKWYQPKRN